MTRSVPRTRKPNSHSAVRAKVSLSEHYRYQNEADRAPSSRRRSIPVRSEGLPTNAEMAARLVEAGRAWGVHSTTSSARSDMHRTRGGRRRGDLGQFVAKTDNFEKGVRILERAVSVLPPGDSYALWFLTALYADEALNPLAANHASLATKALGHARAALTADPKRLVDALEIEDEMEAVLAKSGAGDDRLGAPRD